MEDKKVIETFMKINSHAVNSLILDRPSSINSLNYKKYRIVIEEVSEPTEVLQQRLQELWDNCTNYSRYDEFIRESKALGYTLIGQMGDAKKKQI